MCAHGSGKRAPDVLTGAPVQLMLITDSSTPLLRHLGKVVSQYGDSHISVVSRYRGVVKRSAYVMGV